MGWGFYCHNVNNLPAPTYACDSINNQLIATGNAGGWDAVHSYEVDEEYPAPNIINDGVYESFGAGQAIGQPNGWSAYSTLTGQNPPDVCDTDIYFGNAGASSWPWYSQYTTWNADGAPNITWGAILATGTPVADGYIFSLDSPGRQPPFMGGLKLATDGTSLTLEINTTTGTESAAIAYNWVVGDFTVVVMNFNVATKTLKVFINGSTYSITAVGTLRWTDSSTVRCSYGGSVSNGGQMSFNLYRTFMGYGDIGYDAAASLYDAFLLNYV